MLRRLFTEHPAAVGETFGEHFGHATGFGLAMIGGGLACLVHAVVPGLCKTTGSNVVRDLHDRMVTNRRKKRDAGFEPYVLDWVI